MAAPKGLRRVVPLVGVAEILTWGSSYYLLAVLAQPIAADTGWPLPWIVGGGSLGLLASGLVAPVVGRTIHRFGGRPVMAAGSLMIGAGLVLLAAAPNLAVYFLGWAILGAGMGAGLYDAAFSTLGRLFGPAARPAISTVTLFGGFASTVCWPLWALGVDEIGWRGACLAFAGAHVLVLAPALLLLLPREAVRPPPARAAAGGDGWTTREKVSFALLAVILVLAGISQATISVHLLTVLQARGMPLAAAVAVGTLIGPAQVGARVVERLVGDRLHPLVVLLGAGALTATGMVLLAADVLAPAIAVVLYAAGNGAWSIARGTAPLALFGAARYPLVMGRLAAPNLTVQAITPFAAGIAIVSIGPGPMLGIVAALAATNVGLLILLGARTRGGAG